MVSCIFLQKQGMGQLSGSVYTPNEDVNSVNGKSRKLEVFDRKLEEAIPYAPVI